MRNTIKRIIVYTEPLGFLSMNKNNPPTTNTACVNIILLIHIAKHLHNRSDPRTCSITLETRIKAWIAINEISIAIPIIINAFSFCFMILYLSILMFIKGSNYIFCFILFIHRFYSFALFLKVHIHGLFIFQDSLIYHIFFLIGICQIIPGVDMLRVVTHGLSEFIDGILYHIFTCVRQSQIKMVFFLSRS